MSTETKLALTLRRALQAAQEATEELRFKTNPRTLYDLPEFMDEWLLDSDSDEVIRIYLVKFEPYKELTEEVLVVVTMRGHRLSNSKYIWINGIVYAWHASDDPKEREIVYKKHIIAFTDALGVPDVIWNPNSAQPINPSEEIWSYLGVQTS
jgi:hypothetical protein